ncbi:MAG: xylulokinase [Chloroflexota bacterium]|nr:xylulokinase [Chloroflexota bacterium]
MAYLLGLDVGTTGCKAALFDEAGRTVVSHTEEYPLYHPQPGWAEQEPQEWWQGTVGAIRGVLSHGNVSPNEIAGIGLSGQMHGAVLLDERMQPVRPAIIWSDVRTTPQCREITRTVGAERLVQLAGNPALEGFTAPKVLWVRENEPDNFERAVLLLLPKDYVRFRLTGDVAMEISDAAGTLLFDVRSGRWSEELMGLLGLPTSLLPEVRGSAKVCGHITAEVASLTGLAEGTPVVGGGADNACGAVGTGVVRGGLVAVSIGTSGTVLAHSDAPKIDPLGRVHTFNHAVPGALYLMGVHQAAGFSLRWLRDTLGVQGKDGLGPYGVMTAEASQVPPLSHGLWFLPYLQGERTPHMDAAARGVFFGLSGVHGRGHLTRAVLEGVAYSLRDSVEILREQGVPLEEMRITGGGAQSDEWMRILASVLGVGLVRTSATEGPAFGAALLAGVGAGVYPTIPEACDATIQTLSSIEPEPDMQSRYDEGYALYRDLYPALKNLYSRASAMG